MVPIVKLDQSNIFLPEYRGRLTEGITYNPKNNTLLWVDIIAGEVHRVVLNDEPFKTHEFLKWESPEESIGAITLTSDNDIILICGKYGVAKGNFKTRDPIEYFLKYPLQSKDEALRLRSNDGIIDPWGNLWIGLMNDFNITTKEGVKPEGYLYKINYEDLSIETMIDKTLISNGLAFSEDGKTFYWTDSLTFTIWKFDYDYKTNTLSNKSSHVAIKSDIFPEFESPEPDGLTMTKNEEIYSAVFSTNSVIHVNKQGELLDKIEIPAQKLTCVISGGKDNDELFITTGHKDLLDKDAIIDAKDVSGDLGGFLFKVKLDKSINGQTKNIWGGKV
ncbi:Gluconolactonase putatively [Scheffersomyces coipomensis]|uniref:Gluconolactonase putatively n=1 Tax=Scheffersomyces coipomensis TaxID=1788519 RepID=UPI00315CED0C